MSIKLLITLLTSKINTTSLELIFKCTTHIVKPIAFIDFPVHFIDIVKVFLFILYTYYSCNATNKSFVTSCVDTEIFLDKGVNSEKHKM